MLTGSKIMFPACAQRRGSVLKSWACLVVFVALVGLLQGCHRDPRVQAQKAIKNGNEFMAKSDFPAADVEFRRALQLQPKMPEALYAYGILHTKMRDYPVAYQSLLTAVKYQPEYPEAQVAIADVLLQAGQFDDAAEKANLVMQKYPAMTQAQLIMAEAKLVKGDVDGAQRLIEQYMVKSPDAPRAIFDSAAIDLRNGKWDVAEPKLLKVWQSGSAEIGPIVAIVTKLQRDGKAPQAEAFIKKLLAATPDNEQVSLLLASFYFQNKRNAEAEQILQQVRKTAKDATGRGALAVYYDSTGQTAKAEEELKSIVNADPKDQLNAQRLAQLYMATGRRADARAVVERALKANGSEPTLLTLLGVLQIDDQQYDQATNSLRAAISIDRYSPNALIQLARLQMLQGNAEQAKASIMDALQRSPSNIPALVGAADIELRENSVDQAIAHLSTAISEDPNSVPAQILMAQAKARKGDLKYANDVLPPLVNKAANSQTLDQLGHTLAVIYYQQKQPAKMKSASDAILARDPKNGAGLELLGLSFLVQGNVDAGIAALRHYVDANPWPNGYNIVGGFAFSSRKWDEAISAFQRTLQMEGTNKMAQNGLADSYSAKGDLASAEKIYQGMSSADPANPYPYIRLAQIAYGRQDWNGSKDFYERALKVDPKNFVANNNLAWLLIDHDQKVDLALKYAESAREANPNDPRVADTLGVIYTKKGAYDAAIQQLQECVNKLPSNPEYQFHLATAYYRAGRFQNARPALEAALKLPGFKHAPEARQMLSDVQTR